MAGHDKELMVRIVLFILVILYSNCNVQTPQFDGIDVSHHQGDIKWEDVVQNKNIQFVYIKATEGKTYVDKRYKTNINKAREAGLKAGSYHYFRMTSTPQEQFENMKKHVRKGEQDLIPMIDVETTDKYSVRKTRKALLEFLKLVEEYYGVKPMIYGTNRSYNEICGSEFQAYKAYIGRYGNNKPIIKGPVSHHYTIWQYSESGRINGISKDVDLCRFHPKYDINDIQYTCND